MVDFGCYVAAGPHSDTEMLEYAITADRYGVDTVWCGDHFHPFGHEGARGCGLAWVWMAAAAERTRNARIGCAVTAVVNKYNPAVVAQAYATLGALYPGRIVMGIGAGEAMNEIPVGCEWPSARERIERLEEAVKVIRLLWTEEFVDYDGKHFRMKQANLYTRPERPVELCIAASTSPAVARVAGKYADSFLTMAPPQNYALKLRPALEAGAAAAGRRPESVKRVFGMAVAYDEDYDKAVSSSRYWAGASVPAAYTEAIYDPRELDRLGGGLSDSQLAERLFVCTSAEEFVKPIEEAVRTGFGHVYLSCVSQDQRKFLKMYGEELLPTLRASYGGGRSGQRPVPG